VIARQDLARYKRMVAQGVPLPASTLAAIREAEDLSAADGGDAGKPGEVYRVDDGEHAHDCDCAECAADVGARGVDCGEHCDGAAYRASVLVTKNGMTYRSRRATSAEPGESDDWAAMPPAAPATRASAKAKAAPIWVRALASEIRAWCVETFASRADVERIATTKAGGESTAELEARVAVLEERLSAEAHDWAAASLADCYKGVHCDGQEYRRGSCVTHGGSMWIATTDTAERPGRSSAWKLAVKHGRDVREQR
jgi:hypothetical protein